MLKQFFFQIDSFHFMLLFSSCIMYILDLRYHAPIKFIFIDLSRWHFFPFLFSIILSFYQQKINHFSSFFCKFNVVRLSYFRSRASILTGKEVPKTGMQVNITIEIQLLCYICYFESIAWSLCQQSKHFFLFELFEA